MSWFRRHDTTGKERRNRRLNPMVLLLGMVLYAARGMRSLQDAFSSALAVLAPEDAPEDISKGSIVPARERLPVGVFHEALGHVREVAESVPRPDRLKGFRVKCYDGTTFALADTTANEAAYGRPRSGRGRTGYPRLRCELVMDAATHLFLDEEHGAYELSEAVLLGPLLPRTLGPGDVLEADRNFLSFERAREVLSLGAEFVVRIKSQLRLPVVRELQDGSYLTLYCAPKLRVSRKRYPRLLEELGNMGFSELIERSCTERLDLWADPPSLPEALLLRVVEYDVLDQDGSRHSTRLLTSMLDPEQFTAQEAADGYHLRWSEEGGIRELKWLLDEFRIPNLPGKSPDSIEQELCAILLAHSILRTSMLLASAQHGIDPSRLSLSGARGVLGRYLPRLPHLGSRKLPVWLGKMLSQIARHKLPAPSQRLCPRAVKVKMSKWPTKSRSKSPPSAPNRRRFEFRSSSAVFA
jgi:hypothetical protein